MKAMTCKQLGGACDVEFKAETFDEIAQLSQQHGNEMFQKGGMLKPIGVDDALGGKYTIQYLKFNGQFPVASRDFCIVGH